MSARRARRERFFRAHPVCCYCSGQRAARQIDHNPPRGMFPAGSVPKDMRFPSCRHCNEGKKDAESRAALVASVFNRIDPPTADEVARSVERGQKFLERDEDFRAVITGHPAHTWDFARGAYPGEAFDPMSVLETPHDLPESFRGALLELGRFFAQALYYWTSKRVALPDQKICIQLATNAASQAHRARLRELSGSLRQFVPEPVDARQMPLFGFGVAYFNETSTLYFTGERRGAFAWVGVVGEPDAALLDTKNGRAWFGDGTPWQRT